MDTNIQNLEPKAVWEHFHALTQVPRPSKHEDAIQNFMMKFGQNLGLDTSKDKVGNIIIKKPATVGMENRKGVILQAHLDMVPQKNTDKTHNFEKDPIEAYIDGEWVTANGTTLGADNGMGVAAAMTILASTDIPHGPIECLFTCDEETGMTGAFGLQPNVLNGDILMNLDSEDEGELYIGCAGGIDATATFKNKRKDIKKGAAFNIAIKGLKGGHSGMEINLGRGNSNKLLFRFLKMAADKYRLKLANIDGGSLRNAIPRESFATVVVPQKKANAFLQAIKKFETTIQSELQSVEPDLIMTAEETTLPKNVIAPKIQRRLINAIYACPNGVIRMSNDMEGLVETSINLAIVKSSDKNIEIQALLRSSVESAKEDLSSMFESVFKLAGAKSTFDGAYPGWKPNPKSEILDTMQKVYQEKWGKVPEIKAIHAGLECGLLGAVYPKWDMISFGPTIRGPHSPDEKVNIATVAKFWDFLVAALAAIPQK